MYQTEINTNYAIETQVERLIDEGCYEPRKMAEVLEISVDELINVMDSINARYKAEELRKAWLNDKIMQERVAKFHETTTNVPTTTLEPASAIELHKDTILAANVEQPIQTPAKAVRAKIDYLDPLGLEDDPTQGNPIDLKLRSNKDGKKVYTGNYDSVTRALKVLSVGGTVQAKARKHGANGKWLLIVNELQPVMTREEAYDDYLDSQVQASEFQQAFNVGQLLVRNR